MNPTFAGLVRIALLGGTMAILVGCSRQLPPPEIVVQGEDSPSPADSADAEFQLERWRGESFQEFVSRYGPPGEDTGSGFHVYRYTIDGRRISVSVANDRIVVIGPVDEGPMLNPGRERRLADREAHPPKERSDSLRRGVAWLMSKQRDDGSWRSETYGAMKGGASITALVLYAVGHAPQFHDEYRPQAERGFKFLEQGIAKQGFVVCPDGTLDFPEYATALTLIAARRWNCSLPKNQEASLLAFLLREQRTEQNGFEPSDPDYGGWDLAGGSGLVGQSPGTNISIASFVLEALAPVKTAAADRARELAYGWLAKVQNYPDGDGGFFFHPELAHEGNKAQWEDGEARQQPRSYGTASSDGVRALIYLGADNHRIDSVPEANRPAFIERHRRFTRAIDWSNWAWNGNFVPGFSGEAWEAKWHEGLRFYYYMSLAKAAQEVPRSHTSLLARDAFDVIKLLPSEQREDGSWKNDSARMREDDPLIATSFAVIALAEFPEQDRKQEHGAPK